MKNNLRFKSQKQISLKLQLPIGYIYRSSINSEPSNSLHLNILNILKILHTIKNNLEEINELPQNFLYNLEEINEK